MPSSLSVKCGSTIAASGVKNHICLHSTNSSLNCHMKIKKKKERKKKPL